MIQSILIPFLALFIGGCSSIIGTLYMRFLPGFPLFEWWFQFIQRWETKRPNLFKVLAICADCFSGHLAWVFFTLFSLVTIDFNWHYAGLMSLLILLLNILLFAFSLALASGSAIFFSQIFNDCLDDIKAKKQP